jgi:hypothetical protein
VSQEGTLPQVGAKPPAEKMVPEGQLLAIKKSSEKAIADLKGKLNTTQRELEKASSELDFNRSISDGDAEARVKELKDSIVKQNMELTKRERILEEKEAKVTVTLKSHLVKSLMQDYGLTEEDLASYQTIDELENAQKTLELLKGKNPLAKKSPGGYEFGNSSSSKKPVTQQTDAEFAQHLKELKAGSNK